MAKYRMYRLKALERKLLRLEGADLKIRPERSSDFKNIKQIMGQGLYSKLF